jgi:phospholipid/cholesterol/gamma-HCH transport system permease protein
VIRAALWAVEDGLAQVGAFGYFVVDCARSAMRHGIRIDRISEEAFKVGVRAFIVLAVMAVFVGSNLAIQGHATFRTLGAGNLVGMFVALAGVREVCPLLAATMVAAKVGTELTAQLAVMRTKDQIDALEVMAVDPRAELVGPPLVAIMITLPALTIIGIALSIGSAWLVAVHQLGVASGDFLDLCMRYITLADLLGSLAKSVVFGGIIALVSGFFGLHSEKGPRGVGRATNRAVVAMCILCISVNFLMTTLLYGR